MITKGAEMITLIEFIQKYMEADEDVKNQIALILAEPQSPSESQEQQTDTENKSS